jgi:hypothetical protein
MKRLERSSMPQFSITRLQHIGDEKTVHIRVTARLGGPVSPRSVARSRAAGLPSASTARDPSDEQHPSTTRWIGHQRSCALPKVLSASSAEGYPLARRDITARSAPGGRHHLAFPSVRYVSALLRERECRSFRRVWHLGCVWKPVRCHPAACTRCSAPAKPRHV